MQRNNHPSSEPLPGRLRCAIYTRKSTEEGLEQEFNSLDAQREAAEAFILSQRREGWIALPDLYDDGGFTGANMERPALTRLMLAVEAGELDCVVVYKVDRLSRSLLDFTRMLSVFEKHKVSFVAVTQQFNTSTSLGRLTLNILLSFAQFERELIGERTRDKMSAARRKGKWVGGCPVLGYDSFDVSLEYLVLPSATALFVVCSSVTSTLWIQNANPWSRHDRRPEKYRHLRRDGKVAHRLARVNRLPPTARMTRPCSG